MPNRNPSATTTTGIITAIAIFADVLNPEPPLPLLLALNADPEAETEPDDERVAEDVTEGVIVVGGCVE